jgi:predicted ATPase/class 3 adenylate cyclase
MRCGACGFELTPNAKFCAECGEPVARADSSVLPRTAAPDSPTDGERRQLTVLFSDLVGSTAMASRLDPEDWREVVSAYQEACSEVIERFGGYVAQYLGDGLVVYFGFPKAHEDDALRATRAGLGIVDALAALEPKLARHGVKLAARIGVHTGTVVVGEVGSSARRETLALGDTTNLAARLQEVARPNTVVLSATTFRIVRSHFVTEECGTHSLKGITTPVSVYRAVRPVRVRSTTADGVDSAIGPLLGREEELARLLSVWQRVKEHRGQTVLISGEAGIGKSRLSFAFRQKISDEPLTWLECRASAHTVDTALYPIVTLQEDAFAFGAYAKPEQKTAQIERALEQVGMPPGEHLPLFAALHSLPLPQRYPSRELTPEAQRRRTLESLVEWFLRLGREQPVVVLIEDLHWVDPTTLELIGRLVERSAGHRVLLVITERPGLPPAWQNAENVTRIVLARLGPAHATELARSLKIARSLPDDLVKEIVSRSDGVPLFVEELARTVAEAELAGRGQRDKRPVVPSTLQDSLMARLDQLGPVKEVAQLCATVGREFSFPLLRATSPLAEDELRAALERLVTSQLLSRRGDPPVYSFKHALIQEQAYDSLLKTTRQNHHKKIAEALSTAFPEIATAQPELLAHHYDRAGAFAEAVANWLSAGQRSLGRSANVEASRQLGHGLEALAHLPKGPERDQQELLLLTMRGVALIGARGYAAVEVEQAFARAREICHALGDTPHLFPVQFGLFLYYLVRGDGKSCRELMAQLEATAASAADPEYLLEAHSGRAALSYWEGKFDECHAHILRARLLFDPHKHGHHPFVYGQDPVAYGYSYGTLALFFLGYPDQARQSATKALELAARSNHPLTIAGALSFVADLEYHLKNAEALSDLAEKLSALAYEQGLPMWEGWAKSMQGSAMFLRGERAAGIEAINEGLSKYRATGAEMNTSYALARLAEAYLASGHVEEGLACVDEALELVETQYDRYYEPELLRLKGELTRGMPGPESGAKAEATFERALAIARAQSAKALELRAAMSLARVQADTGRTEAALELLEGVYGWFSEGFETRDLMSAKALIESLRATAPAL